MRNIRMGFFMDKPVVRYHGKCFGSVWHKTELRDVLTRHDVAVSVARPVVRLA